MSYLYLYLGIGLLVGIGFSVRGARAYAKAPPITEVAAQALDPDWQPPKRRWLPLILVSSLIWPMLLLLILVDRPLKPAAPMPEFAVTSQHLQVISQQDSEEAKEALAWAGGHFDPRLFDCRAANAAVQRICNNLWG